DLPGAAHRGAELAAALAAGAAGGAAAQGGTRLVVLAGDVVAADAGQGGALLGAAGAPDALEQPRHRLDTAGDRVGPALPGHLLGPVGDCVGSALVGAELLGGGGLEGGQPAIALVQSDRRCLAAACLDFLAELAEALLAVVTGLLVEHAMIALGD